MKEDHEAVGNLKMCKISHDMVGAKTKLECFKGRKVSPFPPRPQGVGISDYSTKNWEENLIYTDCHRITV